MHVPIRDCEKPYLEYHAGRAVRKVSPRTQHALVQGAMLVILRRCAGAAYRVGTEWDCDLSDRLGTKTLLIPDVSIIATDRLASLPETQRECPPFAPDVAVEVRSPNDRAEDHAWKVRAYLKAGALLVLDVMPQRRVIDAIAPGHVATFCEGGVFHHEAVPWLRFHVSEAFADLI